MSLPSNLSKLVVSETVPNNKIIDPKTGNGTPHFSEWLGRIAQAINSTLTILGIFEGKIGLDATVEGHPGTLATIVSRLTGGGQLGSLTDVASDVDLDHIANTATFQKTTLNEAAGAALAYTSMIAAGPTLNKALLFNGATWLPSDVPFSSVTGAPVVPTNKPHVADNWLDSYNSTTGAFTASQPNFTNLAGTISIAQLPAAGLTVTITTAQLTGLGAQGSMTFSNGILVAQTPAT